jgi:hypothetical protein
MEFYKVVFKLPVTDVPFIALTTGNGGVLASGT